METADGNGSVMLTLLVSAPVISGTQANQATTDQASIDPFSKLAITDANSSNPTETVTVSLTNPANGVLSDPNAATDGGSANNGVGGASGGGVLAQLIGVGPDVTLQTLPDAGSLKTSWGRLRMVGRAGCAGFDSKIGKLHRPSLPYLTGRESRVLGIGLAIRRADSQNKGTSG